MRKHGIGICIVFILAFGMISFYRYLFSVEPPIVPQNTSDEKAKDSMLDVEPSKLDNANAKTDVFEPISVPNTENIQDGITDDAETCPKQTIVKYETREQHESEVPGTTIKKTYYPNGLLWKETPYVNGKIHGVEREYHRHTIEKTVQTETPYVDGQVHGTLYAYHENGQLGLEIRYVNGQAQGILCEYHENGELMQELNVVNGTKHGQAKFYDECGRLVEYGSFVNGEFKNAVESIVVQSGTENEENPLEKLGDNYVPGEIIIAYTDAVDIGVFSPPGKSTGAHGVLYYRHRHSKEEISKEEYCSAQEPVAEVQKVLQELGVVGIVSNTIPGSNSEVVNIRSPLLNQHTVMEELTKIPVVKYVQPNFRYEYSN